MKQMLHHKIQTPIIDSQNSNNLSSFLICGDVFCCWNWNINKKGEERKKWEKEKEKKKTLNH
jgi:hypothetical protein